MHRPQYTRNITTSISVVIHLPTKHQLYGGQIPSLTLDYKKRPRVPYKPTFPPTTSPDDAILEEEEGWDRSSKVPAPCSGEEREDRRWGGGG